MVWTSGSRSTAPGRGTLGATVRVVLRFAAVKRVRCASTTTFAFGQAEWGGAVIVVPVLPGSVVTADRIEARSDGPAPLLVSSPATVEHPNGTLTAFEVIGGNVVREDVLTGESAAAWEVWLGGVGVVDLEP